ncbi:MAG: glycosyltransferase family 4 protein [Epsilonproteobacteria bacterium]|nr:glycosyltransferase family 4 protein [Campylobacterota bacterium]
MKIFGFLSHLDLNLYLFRTPIMTELMRQGHKIYAICPKGDKNQALQESGFEVINYEIDRKGLNPFREKKSIDNIYEAIKDLKLDVLHTFTAKPNIYGTFAAQKAGVPVILNLVEGLGSFYIKDTMKNILIRTLMERLYKKAFYISKGCIFVNSDDPAYMIEKKIIKKEKVKIIKSVGVDTKKFDMKHFDDDKIKAIKEKLGMKDKIIVLMVARAIWDKGVREYYEACDILQATNPNIEFLFVGGTDDGNHSCASESFLKNGNVVWLGHRDDIVELTSCCDIYVLPSYREGLPATLMEATSMAKPIVTTNTFGCRDVVDDNINGFLVPVGDVIDLAQKINILAEDKSLRYRMGKAGREKALNEFDINKVVKQYMEYYEKII